VLAEYRDAAVKQGCDLIQVNLECEVDENVMRMGDEERWGAGKYVDIESLRKWRAENRLARCEGQSVLFVCIDVERLQAEETAGLLRTVLEESDPSWTCCVNKVQINKQAFRFWPGSMSFEAGKRRASNFLIAGSRY
jgi:hypothetical protein